jgi:L-seryl-tRNA(Ser) seleniumtransferase
VRAIGIADEPTAMESIRAGIDVVSFSGDKLLGGPQAGIIAGRKLYIEKIRQNPLFRALRVDKLTIAILEYVLRAYLRGDLKAIPAWKMLLASEAELKTRAEAFAERAGHIVKTLPLKSVVGGGSAPEAYMPSWGVALAVPNLTAFQIEEQLRRSNPPVIARVEEDRVILDFRTISDEEEEQLLRILASFGH